MKVFNITIDLFLATGHKSGKFSKNEIFFFSCQKKIKVVNSPQPYMSLYKVLKSKA